MSLSLVSGKSAFLHDGYILAIESCCAPTAVKRTLMPMRVASLLLGASLNTLFATRLKGQCDGRKPFNAYKHFNYVIVFVIVILRNCITSLGSFQNGGWQQY